MLFYTYIRKTSLCCVIFTTRETLIEYKILLKYEVVHLNMFLGIMSVLVKKKQDNALILFSQVFNNVKHESTFFLLLEVILYMYNNEHSEDSRHVSVSILLNDLTWLKLRSDCCCCWSIAHWLEITEDHFQLHQLKTMTPPADYSLSVAKDQQQLGVCAWKSCLLTSNQLNVQTGVTVLFRTEVHYQIPNRFRDKKNQLFLFRAERKETDDRIRILNSVLWPEGPSSSKMTLRWFEKRSGRNAVTPPDVILTSIRCKTDRRAHKVRDTRKTFDTFHSTGRLSSHSLLCAFLKTVQIPEISTWSFTDSNLKCSPSTGIRETESPSSRASQQEPAETQESRLH